jgi:hypothetical protein
MAILVPNEKGYTSFLKSPTLKQKPQINAKNEGSFYLSVFY